MCHAYQQLNDIGIFYPTSMTGSLKRTCVRRYRKGHLQEYHGGETASGSILTQAGAKFAKEWSRTVGNH